MELFKNSDFIDILAISDLHLCNKLDRIDLLYKAYEYASINDIKYILNLGDVIDSFMPHNKDDLKIKNVYKQIQYVIENYPLYNDIKTYILYGNHDYYQYKLHNIDTSTLINNERADLISLGYGEAYINILDNYIKLSHEIPNLKDYKQNIDTFITFIGHYHSYKVKVRDDSTYIYVPSLSDLSAYGTYNMPSILDVNIKFTNDLFSNIDIKHINIEKNSIIDELDLSINPSYKKHIKIKEELNKYEDII